MFLDGQFFARPSPPHFGYKLRRRKNLVAQISNNWMWYKYWVWDRAITFRNHLGRARVTFYSVFKSPKGRVGESLGWQIFSIFKSKHYSHHLTKQSFEEQIPFWSRVVPMGTSHMNPSGQKSPHFSNKLPKVSQMEIKIFLSDLLQT